MIYIWIDNGTQKTVFSALQMSIIQKIVEHDILPLSTLPCISYSIMVLYE